MKDKLSVEGNRYNKPLYITIKCKDGLIGKMFIDNGKALNMLLRYMVVEIHINASHIKPYTMMEKAYDGSPRHIVETLKVKLYMGPQVFFITLQVMSTHPSCNMLLERLWIHAAGVVTSLLHQCLKYIINRMLITVKAGETISITRNMVVPFIKVKDCRDESIHAFEIVNVERIPENTILRKLKTLK